MARWVEHYTGLYSCPVDIQPETVGLLPILDTWHELDSAPTVEELYLAVKQLKNGKSPAKDEVYTEIVKLKCILPVLHNNLTKCWEQGCVPQDMRDANIVTLYKGKGDRGDCNNYRGISLLSIVKAFARATLAKLQKLADRVAFGDDLQGVHLYTRSDGQMYNLTRLKSKRHREDLFVDSLLFADDAAFVAHSQSQLQTIMDQFSRACNLFSMSINAKKTVILAQGCSAQPKIILNGAPLEVVSKFCYLGSLVSSNLSLDAEIDSRIGRAANAKVPITLAALPRWTAIDSLCIRNDPERGS
ncbi:uncharacterized protein LOC134800778 [Cydia splendana]|uniref:uncharacterized protein LOC134800778 n=1 Tax=Cydia splendana TaxID=1100963 RepID=UPI00300D93C6